MSHSVLNIANNRFTLNFSVLYTDFTAAATSEQIFAHRLPRRSFVREIRTRHRTAFAGGAISAYDIALGTVALPEKYTSRFDVFQAAGFTTYQLSLAFEGETLDTPWSLYAKAWSVGANLDQAAAGACYFVVEGTII